MIKKGMPFILFILLLSAISIACGISQVNTQGTATQAAADLFATQTASIPTFTSTYTPTPTYTFTPTPSQTPTSIPTNTATITPTPTPIFSDLAPALIDLPPGYDSMPPDLLQDMESQFPEGVTAFAFGNEQNAQLIMGFIIPVPSRAEQSVFDNTLPQINELFLTSVGAGANFKDLAGIKDIGNSRSGTTVVGEYGSDSVRWDVVSFRRGEAVVILIVAYPDGDKPDMPVVDLARVLDERISAFLDLSTGVIAPKDANSISGKWTGTAVDLDSGTESQIDVEIQTRCEVGDVCGTFSAVDFGCSSDLALKEINGNTFVFSGQDFSGPSSCIPGGDQSMRLLSNGKLFWRYYYIDDSGAEISSTGILTRP